MNFKTTFIDALKLIQLATESRGFRSHDQKYCTSLDVAVERLKQRLSLDTALPIEYFSPVDPASDSDPTPFINLQSENPDLTTEAEHLFLDVLYIISSHMFSVPSIRIITITIC